MSVIMQIMEYANGQHCPVRGAYVYFVDIQMIPDENWLRVTWHRDKALRFKDAAEALNTWNTILEKDPIRPDGKPNKPLTAFGMLIEDPDDRPLYVVQPPKTH